MLRSLPLLLAIGGCFVRPPETCDPPGTQVSEPRSAGCLTVDQDRLLLVRGSSGWGIPGGGVNAGEASRDAAGRETLEEAGIQVIVGEPICAVKSSGFVAHACSTPDTLPPPDAGSDAAEGRWVSLEELQAMPDTTFRFPERKRFYVVVLEAATAARQRLEAGEPMPGAP